MVLRSTGAMSLGKVLGVLYALIGLLVGSVVSLVSIVGAAIGSGGGDSPEAFLGVFFGVAAIVALPLFYGAMGFIGGLITAALYNVIVGFTGGLELEFTELVMSSSQARHSGPDAAQ